MKSKVTGADLKQIIYQALAPEPLLVEPVSNEDPPEVLKQMKPEQRMSLFARFGFVLKNKVSKELTNNILTNLSSISKASKGKYPS